MLGAWWGGAGNHTGAVLRAGAWVEKEVKVSQVGTIEGAVTVSFRDDAGRAVDVMWTRRDTAAGPEFRFESSPNATRVREVVFRAVVRSGSDVLTNHEHRLTIG